MTYPVGTTPGPSFDDLYRRSLPQVLNTLWHMGIASRDLPDVAQEVFVVVYRHLDTYEAINERAWIAAITWRVAVAHHRLGRNRREQLMTDGDGEVGISDEALTDPERLVASAEVRELVRTLMQTIEENRRIVLVLHELEGLGMREIASALRIPEATAWDRLRRARRDFASAAKRLREHDRQALAVSLAGAAALLGAGTRLDELLLTTERQGPTAPEGLEAQLWARLQQVPEIAAGIGAGAGAGALLLPAQAVLAGMGGAQLVAGAALVFLLGGGAGAALHATWHQQPRVAAEVAHEDVAGVSPAVAEPGAAPVTSSAAAAAIAEEFPAPASSVAASPGPSADASANGSRAEQSDTDAALLKRAGAALGAGNATSALALLERHAQKYARSGRAQEREALTIQALGLAGRRSEASARADSFRRTFPNSMFLPSIETALGSR